MNVEYVANGDAAPSSGNDGHTRTKGRTSLCGKVLILAAVVALSTHSAVADSNRETGQSSSVSPAAQVQPPRQLPSTEQGSLLRHCLSLAKTARRHTDELTRSATHGRHNLNQFQQHLGEVRSAVDSMVEDHDRLVYGLTEEQWRSAKEPITALERIRTSVQVQLEGIDLELQMPTPDSKVLTRYTNELEALLQDWQKQDRKMGTAIGIKL
jgi:hypothetical protein